MSSKLNKLGWTLLAKATVITAIMLTYTYHHDIKKLDYNIFEKKAPVAENFYQNPPILDVKWAPNDQGNIETFLVNENTRKKVPILYDMFPSNQEMVEVMHQRNIDGYQEPTFDPHSLEEVFNQYSLETKKPANLFERVFDYFQGDTQ